MHKQIYVNLPVQDLERSKEFFSELGFTFEPRFTDRNAACMVVSPDIYVMLLSEPFFRTFIPGRKPAEARKHSEVLVALSCDSRREVDELVEKAAAAGGAVYRETQDEGFMYGRAFTDPDGHVWELMFMTPSEEWQPVEGETRIGP